MGASNAVKMLTGSAIVYVIMAACGSGDTRAPSGLMGSDGGNHDGAAGGVDGTGPGPEASNGLLDAITDPVPSAMADPVQSGTRLKAHYYAGEDGSKQFTLTFYDSQRHEDCSFKIAGDGTIRCLPTTAVVFGYYADAACTQQLAGVLTGCTPPKYAGAGTASCPGSPDASLVYPLGAAFSGQTMYVQDPSTTPPTCTGTQSFSLTISYDLYTFGAEIPPSAFAQATLQTDP
jgi:hypothetical protein